MLIGRRNKLKKIDKNLDFIKNKLALNHSRDSRYPPISSREFLIKQRKWNLYVGIASRSLKIDFPQSRSDQSESGGYCHKRAQLNYPYNSWTGNKVFENL